METVAGLSVVIRDVETGDELRAVEELQRTTWGVRDLDVVPLTQLIAAKTAGGVLMGAFDGDEMVGFVYGFAGIEDGQPIHHSHMLAVRPEYRNHDLGRRLKFAQRDQVLKQGIDVMTWTFDPLQSLNAHFNFNKLGVVSDRYFVDFYGRDASSFLHRTGTDRLWVSWLLTSRRVLDKVAGSGTQGDLPDAELMLELREGEVPHIVKSQGIPSAPRVLIEIPLKISEIETNDFELAAAWREATRTAFQAAIGAGYRVVDYFVLTEGPRARGAYLLIPRKDDEQQAA